MNVLDLRTDKERTLFTISLVVSIVFWAALLLGTLGIAILYAAVAAGIILVTQALFLAALKNNGVKITKEQLPELYARIENGASRLQMNEVPEAYLLNERGLFNAFATRFLGRDFIVLYAELLEACDEKDGSIDFIIGHELGHLALQHVKLAPVLFPARFVPLLGPAYSRAREYSCDRAGAVVAQSDEGAVHGLMVLAAGRRYSKRVDVEKYMEQREDSIGFWAAVVELGMYHPYLPKRIAAILADTRPELDLMPVERNVFAYIAAPFFGMGGAGAGVMAAVMAFGIGAAVAIPGAMSMRQASAEPVPSLELDPDRSARTDADRLRAADRVRESERLREAEERIAKAEAAAKKLEERVASLSAAAAVPVSASYEAQQQPVVEKKAKKRGKKAKAAKSRTRVSNY